MISDDNNTKNNHTILVTSPTSGNGKTFVTRKLAEKMAQLNNKVLLLDIDWKRGDQHKYAEKSTITLEDFKKIDEESLEKNYKQDNGLYLIPRISKLNNSFQFLYSPDFDKKLSELKGLFDYIIIDTAPLLSVSDTSILLSYSDINLAIVKHGLTKINEIRQVLSISDQIGIGFDGIVYNGFKKPSSYYGYYSLYGSYDYQYYANRYLYESYDYEKDGK